MRFRIKTGIDLATGALIVGGAALLAASVVVAFVLLSPPAAPPEAPQQAAPTPVAVGRPSLALPSDQVATVLSVDAAAGAGSAARIGDHVDVLGFFPRQATGTNSVTRVLLQDVPVLGVDRSGSGVALTLALPQASALLLQEAQALGARPYVTLRPLQPLPDLPSSFSDADLASRLTAGGH